MSKKTIPLIQFQAKRPKKIFERQNITPETEEVISRIAREHSSNTFGYLNKDDLENEIWLICLEILPSFNKDEGQLENFLRVSVKNRLVNKFKEITKSVKSPCQRCEFYNENGKNTDCKKFQDAGFQARPEYNRTSCPKWKKYITCKSSRNSLLNPVELKEDYDHNNTPDKKLISKELREILLDRISKESLPILESVLEGENVPRAKLDRLRTEVLSVIQDTEGYV